MGKRNSANPGESTNRSRELLHDEIFQVMGLSGDFIADLNGLGELGNGRFQATLASPQATGAVNLEP
jgi:hypothetical protein